MSENFAPGTIPTDSLVITRKVMTGSSSSLETLVCEEAQLQELHVVTSSVKTMKKFTVDLVGRDEYAKAKTEHPNLTYWSVGKLVNDFNQEIHAERNPLTDYLSHVSLGEVVYEEVEDGKFKVGFTFGDEFRQRLAAERTQSIDTLLDMAELPPTDNFRNWRNEKAELWLPVLSVRSNDPAIEGVLEDFAGKLEERTEKVAIDIFDVIAKQVIVDIPA